MGARDPDWQEHDGESWTAVTQRQIKTFEEVMSSSQAIEARAVVFIGHQSTCRSILLACEGFGQKEWTRLNIPQGSITHLSYRPEETAGVDKKAVPLKDQFTIDYVGLTRQDFEPRFAPRLIKARL